ncbi:MAG: VOC family protein [Caulobacteraceae bacterium]
MIEGLDHVALAVGDLEGAAGAWQGLVGRPPDRREEAAGARHAWFQFSNAALDIVAAQGKGEAGDRVRAQIAERGEGIWGLALAVEDLGRARALFERRGLASGEPADFLSTTRKLAVLDPAATGGLFLALAERRGPAPAAPRAGADAVSGIDHVVAASRSPDRAAALWGARLGLDLRLDRSNEAWGSRLMFFRLGDLVLEVATPLKRDETTGGADDRDRYTGFALRVGDVEAAQARLCAGGFAISKVRAGRKPGTRVATVRSGVPGAPVLLIGP